MANISEVYGNNYEADALARRQDYIVNIMAKNIAHRNFNFKFTLDNCNAILWKGNPQLDTSTINQLKKTVTQLNKDIKLHHINKNNNTQMKVVPFVIVDSPVDYFIVTDKSLNRMYTIYITPTEMGAY